MSEKRVSHLAIRKAHSLAGDNESWRGTNLRNDDAHWVAQDGWIQLPGVFFSSEIESIGDEFLVENAGYDRAETPLYSVYVRATKNSLLPR